MCHVYIYTVYLSIYLSAESYKLTLKVRFFFCNFLPVLPLLLDLDLDLAYF
jgi:hypothetical protein